MRLVGFRGVPISLDFSGGSSVQKLPEKTGFRAEVSLSRLQRICLLKRTKETLKYVSQLLPLDVCAYLLY